MNPLLLRYVGFALVASIFGIGGGYLAVNNKTDQPALSSGTTVAVPAQPFPGQGIPAIPAVPATPWKGKREFKAPVISYIQQGDEHGMRPQNTLIGAGTLYDDSAVGLSFPRIDGCVMWNDVCLAWGTALIGTNFLAKNNSVYWDDVLITKNAVSSAYSNDLQEIIVILVPPSAKLGSSHKVYVKNAYGTSNAIQVQIVE